MKGYLCLTSLPAWWARVEKEEKQFYKEVAKERMEKKRKETKNAEKSKEKENVIIKFFPDCNTSPGGTLELTKKKYLIKANVRTLNLLK